jgi:hypothetical protein
MNNPRNLRLLGLLAPLALTAAVCTPAAALDATRTRETYFAAGPSAPELANAYLRAHPSDAIEIISFGEPGKEPTQIFHAFGPPSRSRAGVCRFTATQVFPHRSDDRTVAWDSTPPNPREHAEPPYTMAAVAGTSCPRQNEAAYAALEPGINDAEFVAISNFWKATAKSEQKFDDASGLLPLIISSRAAEAFDGFRSAVLQPSGAPLQLQAVFRAGVDSYDLAFGDSPSVSSSFFLSISKSASGFQFVNFQTQF